MTVDELIDVLMLLLNEELNALIVKRNNSIRLRFIDNCNFNLSVTKEF